MLDFAQKSKIKVQKIKTERKKQKKSQNARASMAYHFFTSKQLYVSKRRNAWVEAKIL